MPFCHKKLQNAVHITQDLPPLSSPKLQLSCQLSHIRSQYCSNARCGTVQLLAKDWKGRLLSSDSGKITGQQLRHGFCEAAACCHVPDARTEWLDILRLAKAQHQYMSL